jgi:2-aminoethylphosphonate-pyruvate transaminase
MHPEPSIPRAKDKLLFTPGPLTTSASVKQAMLRDLGSRDEAFLEVVRDVRRRLLAVANAPAQDYTAVLMQGSGTFGVESVVSTTVPRSGELLAVVNGAYGRRIVEMAKVLAIPAKVLEFPECEVPDAGRVEEALKEAPGVAAVAVVHCETTTGIVNPIAEIGDVCRRYGRRYIVDAMSSFGAIPIDAPGAGVDYLVSSANKCIEGVPGFSFAICRTKDLERTGGWARSLSLDLYAQWKGLESNGQFRFTPPTHALLAFRQALVELEAEGGVEARGERYRRNHAVLTEGMRALGFVEYLPADRQGPIITSFRFPARAAFDFEDFYRRLSERGYVIYPGKVSDADCFRIGHIGRIFESDVRDLLAAVREVAAEMGLAGGRGA